MIMLNNIKQIKETILNNIKTARENGITLITEDWGRSDKKCACALGCILINNNHVLSDEDSEHYNAIVQDYLNVWETWVDQFIRGYDGETPTDVDIDAYRLGQDICALTNPITFNQFNKVKV